MHLLGFDGMMIRRLFRRLRLVKMLFILFITWNCIDVLNVRRNLYSVQVYTERSTILPNQRIFIASLHWNSEVLLRSHWNNAIVELARLLGPENIHISIYESGSWDDTKGALSVLDHDLEKLGVPRTIALAETTHFDELAKTPGPGWIHTSGGKTELRRIPYLARLRNTALKPLEELEKSGIRFDNILFLNDVVFSVARDLAVFQENC